MGTASFWSGRMCLMCYISIQLHFTAERLCIQDIKHVVTSTLRLVRIETSDINTIQGRENAIIGIDASHVSSLSFVHSRHCTTLSQASPSLLQRLLIRLAYCEMLLSIILVPTASCRGSWEIFEAKQAHIAASHEVQLHLQT